MITMIEILCGSKVRDLQDERNWIFDKTKYYKDHQNLFFFKNLVHIMITARVHQGQIDRNM